MKKRVTGQGLRGKSASSRAIATHNSYLTPLKRWWQASAWHKIVTVTLTFIILVMGGMYGIAQWYIRSEASKPYVMGVSFIPDYAQSLGVDPKATMDALLGIGVKHFRLVSYWSDLEPAQGKYDFSQLDWQFSKAEAKHAKITLSVGLRQPRWPECHMPDWAKAQPAGQWQQGLQAFISQVVKRYHTSSALDSYQIENEYFLQGFGQCSSIAHSMDRDRLVAEYNLVKKLDPQHAIIINRSNNALGWPVGAPTPDKYGISIYKRVWDATLTHRYLEYPFPAWYYGFVAGWQKIMTGHDMIIHELQAEAWAPNNKFVTQISLAEQNKSFNAQRFEGRFKFAKGTGMREVYFWGAEYWYYRQQILHDSTIWNVARQEFGTPQ